MAKVAFIDVDTQVDFVEPSGKLYARGAEAIKPIEKQAGVIVGGAKGGVSAK